MKVGLLNKNIKIEDKENNKIFYIKNILDIKKEKIDILIGYKISILFRVLCFILRIPVLKIVEDIDLEKRLQRKIAYYYQKDIPVLMYHRVISSEKEKGVYDTAILKEEFEKQMRYLIDNNYEIVTFEDLADGKYKERFEKKYVIITFDDGYKDNYYNVLPILKKYGIKIVLYLVSDSTYNEWDVEVENREKEKRFELMTKEELLVLNESGLIEFGGHTKKHLYMKNVAKDIMLRDLKESKEKIEKLIGKKLVSFAYPWGANDRIAQESVKELGYEFAVSTESGTACFSDNLFEIKRVGIYYKDDIKKFEKKVSGNYTFMQENRDNLKKLRNRLRKKLGLRQK